MGGILTSLGSFFKLRWRGILIIVAGILIISGVGYFQNLIVEKTRAVVGYNQVEQALQDQKEAMKELQRQNDLVIKINKKYRENIRELRNDMVEVSDEIQKLERKNEEVADWASDDVPPAVLNRLRGYTQSSNENGNTESNSTREMSDTN